eukprot:scaffold45875_cov34-Phaeocystis_antarctica.AAC.2
MASWSTPAATPPGTGWAWDGRQEAQWNRRCGQRFGRRCGPRCRAEAPGLHCGAHAAQAGRALRCSPEGRRARARGRRPEGAGLRAHLGDLRAPRAVGVGSPAAAWSDERLFCPCGGTALPEPSMRRPGGPMGRRGTEGRRPIERAVSRGCRREGSGRRRRGR